MALVDTDYQGIVHSLTGRKPWYVNASAANDTAAGTSPNVPKKTFAAVVALTSAGEDIYLAPGIYSADGETNNLAGKDIGLIGQPGTILMVGNNFCYMPWGRQKNITWCNSPSMKMSFTGTGTGSFTLWEDTHISNPAIVTFSSTPATLISRLNTALDTLYGASNAVATGTAIDDITVEFTLTQLNRCLKWDLSGVPGLSLTTVPAAATGADPVLTLKSAAGNIYWENVKYFSPSCSFALGIASGTMANTGGRGEVGLYTKNCHFFSPLWIEDIDVFDSTDDAFYVTEHAYNQAAYTTDSVDSVNDIQLPYPALGMWCHGQYTIRNPLVWIDSRTQTLDGIRILEGEGVIHNPNIAIRATGSQIMRGIEAGYREGGDSSANMSLYGRSRMSVKGGKISLPNSASLAFVKNEGLDTTDWIKVDGCDYPRGRRRGNTIDTSSGGTNPYILTP